VTVKNEWSYTSIPLYAFMAWWSVIGQGQLYLLIFTKIQVNCQFHTPAALPRGKRPRYPLEGGWVGPRAGLDAVAKRKILFIAPAGNWIPGRPARSLVTILTELLRLLYHGPLHVSPHPKSCSGLNLSCVLMSYGN
jgi:hypothetical protein